MAVDIPSGLESIRAQEVVRDDWLKKIFDEIQKVARDVGRVNSRLNCSDTKEAIAVWAGTYEDDAIEKEQGFKADDMRFGKSNRSKIYTETITDRDGNIHEKDWSKGFAEKDDVKYGPAQAYGPRAGCVHQLYIAIRIKDGTQYRHVGTITVGFRSKPDRAKVDPILKRWASEGSNYVGYLQKNFNLGGPVF